MPSVSFFSASGLASLARMRESALPRFSETMFAGISLWSWGASVWVFAICVAPCSVGIAFCSPGFLGTMWTP